MKIFSSLYRRTMEWSRHPKAPWFLGILSFAESSFFPIPPDVMLAPMCLANPKRAWWYAFLTMVTSVLGGLLGYLIGLYAFSWIEPFLRESLSSTQAEIQLFFIKIVIKETNLNFMFLFRFLDDVPGKHCRNRFRKKAHRIDVLPDHFYRLEHPIIGGLIAGLNAFTCPLCWRKRILWRHKG